MEHLRECFGSGLATIWTESHLAWAVRVSAPYLSSWPTYRRWNTSLYLVIEYQNPPSLMRSVGFWLSSVIEIVCFCLVIEYHMNSPKAFCWPQYGIRLQKPAERIQGKILLAMPENALNGYARGEGFPNPLEDTLRSKLNQSLSRTLESRSRSSIH